MEMTSWSRTFARALNLLSWGVDPTQVKENLQGCGLDPDQIHFLVRAATIHASKEN